jgi:ATP-dependent RNA helicase DDX19/DBP5
VVNFDLPVDKRHNADCATYLRRIGRAGRSGRPGYAVSLVDGPQSVRVLKQMEDHFGKETSHLDAEDVGALRTLEQELICALFAVWAC